jgi:CBS domain-containing protein
MRNSTTTPRLVKDLMTSDVQTLGPLSTVADARSRMLLGAINSIPVMSDDGRVVGIVSSHDLVDDWDDDILLSEIMTLAVVTIEAEATIAEAAQIMRAELVHHLVVTEVGAPIGIVSTFDLLDALTG